MKTENVEIEIEIDSDLMHIIALVARERGISAEQCIGEIIRQYIERHPKS